jgi:hypothetical protein
MEASSMFPRNLAWLLVLCAVVSSRARAQQRVGPVYPENKSEIRSTPSGYDPFIFNWSSGRWEYVPIPYDIRSGPFAFNWHSGRWDYYGGDFEPSSVYSGREPERIRGEGGPVVVTLPARQMPSVDQAGAASATLPPVQPHAPVNRPAPMIGRKAFNYTTSDSSFDDWYRSASK